MKKTRIEALGEFGLIRHLTENIKTQNESTVYGIGDDAAIIDYDNKESLVSTDLLMEGIHFNLVYTPLKHLGYKSIIVNLSDIYAMNGKPEQVVVSIAISSKFTVEAIEELYEGMKEACREHQVDMVGGDTTSSLTGLVISITAIGSVEKGKAIKRNSAKETDLICVSGDLGGAYLGLQILEREKAIYMKDPEIQPKLTNYEYVLQRQLKPVARRDIVSLLKEHEVTPSAMIDVSDGLSSEILHISNQSNLGCRIYQEKIPIRYEARLCAEEIHLDPIIAAMNGGEDYELLFTVPVTQHEKLVAIPGVSIIGHMTHAESGHYLVPENGEDVKIEAQGWNPIKG
ncbi:MAG: thiamine-phosphate kinase [Bacteroidales bacterium]|jgi:thiamine-monophosphate kinase|nr:thiamine-phosphate kinase [Bacteroidales bacterium]